MGSCILVFDLRSIRTLDGKRQEKMADIKAERETALAGIKASKSLAVLSMSGQLNQPGNTSLCSTPQKSLSSPHAQRLILIYSPTDKNVQVSR